MISFFNIQILLRIFNIFQFLIRHQILIQSLILSLNYYGQELIGLTKWHVLQINHIDDQQCLILWFILILDQLIGYQAFSILQIITIFIIIYSYSLPIFYSVFFISSLNFIIVFRCFYLFNLIIINLILWYLLIIQDAYLEIV